IGAIWSKRRGERRENPLQLHIAILPQWTRTCTRCGSRPAATLYSQPFRLKRLTHGFRPSKAARRNAKRNCVLVFVFVPLDLVLQQPSSANESFSGYAWLYWLSPQHWVTVFFAVAGVALIYFGIRIEREALREEEGGQ